MTVDMEQYRCPVCGSFDFDEDGSSTPCAGPPREEPDFDDSGWDE